VRAGSPDIDRPVDCHIIEQELDVVILLVHASIVGLDRRLDATASLQEEAERIRRTKGDYEVGPVSDFLGTDALVLEDHSHAQGVQGDIPAEPACIAGDERPAQLEVGRPGQVVR
jgi:hypothetical protein